MFIQNFLMQNTAVVATHDGSFHADEVAAVAITALALGCAVQVSPPGMGVSQVTRSPGVVSVIRTRNLAEIAQADIALDVGMVYDPERGRLDHHQPRGAGLRDDGKSPFATAGLAWLHFGDAVLRRLVPALNDPQRAEIFRRMDTSIFRPIDCADNGVAIHGPHAIQIPGLVSALNPSWLETDVPKASNLAFEQAVGLLTQLLRARIQSYAAEALAVDVVLQAAEKECGGIIVLPQALPWEGVICEASSTAKLVLVPTHSGNVNVFGVPKHPYSFERRHLFPAQWAGLEHGALAEVSGVEGAVFCHRNRFMAVGATHEAAMRLAIMAI